MALSEQQYQDLIVAEVGDDASAVLASTVPLYWARYSAYDLETRFLYTKRAAIDLMLGRVRAKVDVQVFEGPRKSMSQLFDHLTQMRATVEALISTADQVGSAGAASGDLTTTAPIMPPAGSRIDANDRAYRGDPYTRRRR